MNLFLVGTLLFALLFGGFAIEYTMFLKELLVKDYNKIRDKLD